MVGAKFVFVLAISNAKPICEELKTNIHHTVIVYDWALARSLLMTLQPPHPTRSHLWLIVCVRAKSSRIPAHTHTCRCRAAAYMNHSSTLAARQTIY